MARYRGTTVSFNSLNVVLQMAQMGADAFSACAGADGSDDDFLPQMAQMGAENVQF